MKRKVLGTEISTSILHKIAHTIVMVCLCPGFSNAIVHVFFCRSLYWMTVTGILLTSTGMSCILPVGSRYNGILPRRKHNTRTPPLHCTASKERKQEPRAATKPNQLSCSQTRPALQLSQVKAGAERSHGPPEAAEAPRALRRAEAGVGGEGKCLASTPEVAL